MKKYLSILTGIIFCAGLVPAFAQFGGSPGGPKFDATMAKLFGDNTAFTAMMEFQIMPKGGDAITMPGKISFEAGKARFEMDLAEAKGLKLPPQAATQMKSMGLDRMVTLALPDKNITCLIYPGLQSYVEMPLPPDKTGTNENLKVETTELGKATVDGHACVENKVIITDDKGMKHESTVWNATDMKNFPLKIVHSEQGTEITMLFNRVSLTKPAASVFEVPAGYARYDNMQTMIQTEMMKKLGGGFGQPPQH